MILFFRLWRERRIINADILFDTHCHNVYKMVSMKKDPIK